MHPFCVILILFHCKLFIFIFWRGAYYFVTPFTPYPAYLFPLFANLKSFVLCRIKRAEQNQSRKSIFFQHRTNDSSIWRSISSLLNKVSFHLIPVSLSTYLFILFLTFCLFIFLSYFCLSNYSSFVFAVLFVALFHLF